MLGFITEKPSAVFQIKHDGRECIEYGQVFTPYSTTVHHVTRGVGEGGEGQGGWGGGGWFGGVAEGGVTKPSTDGRKVVDCN